MKKEKKNSMILNFLDWTEDFSDTFPHLFKFLVGFIGTLLCIVAMLVIIYLVNKMSIMTIAFVGIPTAVGIVCAFD